MLATQSMGQDHSPFLDPTERKVTKKIKSHNMKHLYYSLGLLVGVAYIFLENGDCVADSQTMN